MKLELGRKINHNLSIAFDNWHCMFIIIGLIFKPLRNVIWWKGWKNTIHPVKIPYLMNKQNQNHEPNKKMRKKGVKKNEWKMRNSRHFHMSHAAQNFGHFKSKLWTKSAIVFCVLPVVYIQLILIITLDTHIWYSLSQTH